MTNTTPAPGLRDQAGTRTTLRVVGGVLLLVGVVLAIWGITGFVRDFDSMDGGPGPVLLAGAGGFLAVIGLGMLSAGTLGAQARYAAGETMPVVKDSAAYLTDGQGIAGIGRTAGATFCSECGKPVGADAKFCSSCGHAV